jgi:hypothetical protein
MLGAETVAVRHPSMTTRGTQLAFLFAVLIAFALPKRVECSYPGQTCGHTGRHRDTCASFEIEPLGFYLIELVAHRDVGFAYQSDDECR